jgi:hypothetical protein
LKVHSTFYYSFSKAVTRLVYKLCAVAIAALPMWSCSTTPPKSESLLKPEITIRIASLDLAHVRKRIDKKDILALAQIVKNEGIEVLAVQNISRYPGMTSRVDFVDELSARSDMRNVFGEMINNSGRQTGNAIFSLYPILTNRNQSFEKIKSASFEAALEAVVDAGVQPLTVVSTQFPDQASKDDQERCLKLILDMNPNPEKQPMIIAGNLPPALKTTIPFEEVAAREMKPTAGNLWFCSRRSLRILNSNTVETGLGHITVARFGLYRQ